MLFHPLIALGAYGKQYTSEEQVKAAWDAGKDFKIYGGTYFSKRDSAKLLDAGYDGTRVVINGGKYVDLPFEEEKVAPLI